MGCHFLLQGIFPTQGSNSHFLCVQYWQVDSLPLGSIYIDIKSACSGGDPGLIPGSGWSPGEGHGYHSSIPACRIPRVRHAWVTDRHIHGAKGTRRLQTTQDWVSSASTPVHAGIKKSFPWQHNLTSIHRQFYSPERKREPCWRERHPVARWLTGGVYSVSGLSAWRGKTISTTSLRVDEPDISRAGGMRRGKEQTARPRMELFSAGRPSQCWSCSPADLTALDELCLSVVQR